LFGVTPHPPARRFFIEIPVRFRDLDPLGHVNNSVYFTYLEEARMAYWRKLRRDDGDPFVYVLARVECDFVAALELHETVRVEVCLVKIGTSSFDMEYEMFDRQTDRLVARGRSVQVMIDAQSGRPRPIDPQLKDRMRSFAARRGDSPEPEGKETI
jgi:acyl-CoA thioester hydrolase